MYRLAVETLLDLEKLRDYLTISHRLPPDGWTSFKIHYRFFETFYHIEVPREKDTPTRVTLDGQNLPDHRIPLINDQTKHPVEVIIDV